jgi:membrane-associated phospholipid phosphatase
MGLAYDLIFLLPLTLLIILSVRGKRTQFREMAFALVLCFIIGFILYLIFPAGPPRFYLNVFNTMPPLTGFLGYYDTTKELWDMANQMIVHSSFPSMHIALSIVTLVYVYRQNFWPSYWNFIRPVYMFFIVSLWVSTIYLRHHWTPDIVAGCLLGMMSAMVARTVYYYLAPLELK